VVVLFFALLIAYPWVMLTAGTLAYLGGLPFGWLSYRKYDRRTRESKAEAATAAQPAPFSGDLVRPADNDDRPSRFN
jgi:CDP-diacylglycerol--serine O-phosphatidyltransferase